MIYTLAFTKDHKIIEDLSLEEIKKDTFKWFWVDIENPTEEENKLLHSYFSFHPLAIESCFHKTPRPKLDFYEDHAFSVMHYIDEKLKAKEVNCFFNEKIVVSYHKETIPVIEKVKTSIKANKKKNELISIDVFHTLLDELVDSYFPIMYNLEDVITNLDDNPNKLKNNVIIDKVFDVRSELIHLRKTISPMRDLVYRAMNSTRLGELDKHKYALNDIYNHLLKLTEILDSNRELTADIRDNYISNNGNRMNSIMMTLTVITTIFMPLSFIAGLEGMNYSNMPELHGKYNYFIMLGIMVTIATSMYIGFKKKGWFDN